VRGVRIPLQEKFAILAHPKAPILSRKTPREASLIVEQLAQDMASGHYDTVGEAYDLIREAAFVNLHFFLKNIAGHSGPYNDLNDDLHLDMCNFRQSKWCMAPGARAFGFVHRGGYKSTIFSHGADQWEIIRWPNIRISLRNAIFDRASQFLGFITATFHDNELAKVVLPEYWVENPRSQGCNAFEFMCPARDRFFGEPTVKAGAASGSVEGDHFDVSNPDDLAGGDDLDLEHRANINMEKKKRWFATNQDALLVNPRRSRIVGVGTRWGPDDFYQPIFEDAVDVMGFRPEWFKPVPNGKWTIYYRMSMENGKPTNPELYDESYLARKAKDDPWYFLTQLQNSPYAVGLTEFSRLEVPMGRAIPATLEYEDGRVERDTVLVRDASMDPEQGDPFVRLSQCHVLGVVDPAVTDKGILAKACRSAAEIWAMDREGYSYFVDGRVGHFNIFQLFEAIFDLAKVYEGMLSAFYFERNGFQKVLGPLLYKEREERNVWVDFDSILSEGEKEAKIRSILGRELMNHKLVVCQGVYTEFQEEKLVFPQSRYRMDVLDAAQMGISALVKPRGPEEGEDPVSSADMKWIRSRSKVTGY